jgi:hypothetical protein
VDNHQPSQSLQLLTINPLKFKPLIGIDRLGKRAFFHAASTIYDEDDFASGQRLLYNNR